MGKIDISPEHAFALDAGDEIARYRNYFQLGDPELIYMDGNSLGRRPLLTSEVIANVISNEWGDKLIRSWGTGWFDAPLQTGEKIARLIGAAPGQVVVSDSTTVNLYKLAMSALMMKPDRKKIITDTLNFPSDIYMLQGCINSLGNRNKLHLLQSADEIMVDTQQVMDAIDQDTALVTLSHVVFKSGYMYDARRITRYAHEKGALVLWDLSHAAGSVPVELDEWEADFAAGCTYKYLNGGPGAPAFLYVNHAIQNSAISPIWGWFGDKNPFNFDLSYSPAEGIKRFLSGTPPVLSIKAIEPGVDLILEIGMDRLRAKSAALSNYLITLSDEILSPLGFELGSPREISLRGSHVSLQHKEGYRINRALIEEMKVIPDFREPNNIRLGLAPAYTSFVDVWECINRISYVITEERYKHFSETRQKVT